MMATRERKNRATIKACWTAFCVQSQALGQNGDSYDDRERETGSRMMREIGSSARFVAYIEKLRNCSVILIKC